MKKPLIIGNWKAHPATIKDARSLIRAVEKMVPKTKGTYGYAVPDLFLTALKEEKRRGLLGLQNIGSVDVGSFTGKSSVSMALSVASEFVIVGHSEVRAKGETNEEIQQKVRGVLSKKVPVILCVGEVQRDKNGEYLQTIDLQIKKALEGITPTLCEKLIIAYEPVWAVGSITPATPDQCFEVIIAIRRTVASLLGMEHAKKVLVLYGGDVNKDNAHDFLTYGGADGLLVGRASLDAKTFAGIIEIAHEKGH